MRKNTLLLLYVSSLFIVLTTTTTIAQTTPQGTTIDDTTITVVLPNGGETVEINEPDRLITVEWNVVNKPEKAGDILVSLKKIEDGEVSYTKNLIRYQGDSLASLSGSADFLIPYSVVSGEYYVAIIFDRIFCSLNYDFDSSGVGNVVLDTPCATTDYSDSTFTLVNPGVPQLDEELLHSVVLTDVSPTSVRPGEFVTISGENFGQYSDVWVIYKDNSFWSTVIKKVKNINNTVTFKFPDYLDTRQNVSDVNDISGVTYPIKDGVYFIRVRNRDNLYTSHTYEEEFEITSGLSPKINDITTPDRNEVVYAQISDMVYIFGLNLCKESDNTIIFKSYDDPSIYTISEHVATMNALSSWYTGELSYDIPSSIQTHDANGNITGTIPVTPGRYNVSITKKLGDLTYESNIVTISIIDTIFTVSSISQTEGGPGEEITIYGENFGSNNSIWLEGKSNWLIRKIFIPTEQTSSSLTIIIPETVDFISEKLNAPYKTEPITIGEYTLKVVDEITKITSKKFDFTITDAAEQVPVYKKGEIPPLIDSVEIPVTEVTEVQEVSTQSVEVPVAEIAEVQEPSTQEDDLQEDMLSPGKTSIEITTTKDQDEDIGVAVTKLEVEPEKTKEETAEYVSEKPTPKEESNIITKSKEEDNIVISLTTKEMEKVYEVVINIFSFFGGFFEKSSKDIPLLQKSSQESTVFKIFNSLFLQQ